MTQYTDLSFRRLIVGTQGNVPATGLNNSNEQYITVHQTANPDDGANALMHANFVKNGGGPDNVSFHFAVDSKEAIQILDCWRIGYHAGDGCEDRATDFGCYQSLAIETCENADGDWQATKRNLSKLIAMIVLGDERISGLKQNSYSFKRVNPHQKWSGKYCPHTILDEGSLPAIIADAAEYAMTPITYAKAHSDLQEKLGDLNHLAINGARLYRFRDWIAFEKDAIPYQYASLSAPAIGPRKPAGTHIQVVGIIAQANGLKWFLGKDNARYVMTEHTVTIL